MSLLLINALYILKKNPQSLYVNNNKTKYTAETFIIQQKV